MSATRSIGFLGGLVLAVSGASAGTLTVTSFSPARFALTAQPNAPISVTFDRAMNPATVSAATFAVFGRWSGPAPGSFAYSNGDKTVTFTPSQSFFAGETVTVTLSRNLQAADGSPLRNAGYSFLYWIRTLPGTLIFTEIDEFSNRTTPGAATRIYGAAGSDLNRDEYPDLVTVNEDSADIRVALNRADGTGLYHSFLAPYPISFEASPNEPSDFNGDGFIDLATAAVQSSSVWIVFGNGDGTFGTSQQVSVGSSPHGLVILDADGDGDMDIATSNTGGNNVSLILNNGSGVFGPATSFEGGGNGEYALAAGDMDNDGITDLVVGTRGDERIIVHRGNGNATFTALPFQDAGGLVWMTVLGDVNGDGFLDVTSANSGSATGSILLGNGDGSLNSPTTTPTASHVVATDLGDFDGDGDLDWVLSSFGGGAWRLFLNDGSGAYAFQQEYTANNNPSCATVLDFDRDGDLDLALSDEIADVMTLLQNSGPAVAPAVSFGGSLVCVCLILFGGALVLFRSSIRQADANGRQMTHGNLRRHSSSNHQ